MNPNDEKLKNDSGNVVSNDPLVTLLYLLARDHLPIGTVEAVVQTALAAQGENVTFTNGWLANWAKNAKQRITDA